MPRLLPCFFFYAFIHCSLFGQSSLEFGKDHFLFFDARNNEPVLVVNDSILYSGYGFEKQQIANNPGFKILDFQHPYSFQIQKQTYLVADGCGPVLEFRNNGFYRIDNSFPQRNQYFASPFTFNGEIHLFGGYGLFTHKNLVTKYNFKTAEWTQSQIPPGEKPTERFRAFSFTWGDNLYVFGGFTKNPEKVQEHIKVGDGTVWKLHLPTMKWEKYGKYDASHFGIEPYKSFQTENKLYLIYEKIYEVDFEENTIKTFAFKEWKGINDIVYDTVQKKVVYTYLMTNKGSYTIMAEPLKDFLGKLETEESFVKSNYSWAIYLVGALMIVLLMMVMGKYIQSLNKKKKELIFDSKRNTFHFNKKPIVNLNENTHDLLVFLSLNKERWVSLNEINDLFGANEKNNNHIAINKRRETAQSDLLFKLGNLLNKPNDEILLERKNPKDMRLKELKLAPNVVRITL